MTWHEYLGKMSKNFMNQIHSISMMLSTIFHFIQYRRRVGNEDQKDQEDVVVPRAQLLEMLE